MIVAWRRIAWGRLAAVAVACVFAASLSTATGGEDGTRQAFEKRKRKALLDAGQRHLEIGVWCRDQGLVQQATAEFIRAVEVSEGRHPGAQKLLAVMRQYDERFWKKQRKNPPAGLLAVYDRKAEKAALDEQTDRLDLAAFAQQGGLADEAIAEYTDLLRRLDAPLSFDGKERIVLPGGTVPEGPSARIKAAAISVKDAAGAARLWVRDEFLARLPEVKEISEAAAPRVRVRTQRGADEAADLLALAQALLPRLEEDTGGRPTRRMNVFVFADRKTWGSYLDAAKISGRKLASGLAVSGDFTALVCAEGHDADAVRGIVLHELSHLFDFGVTRAVMPSWYREGFAETYGATGTFSWTDGKLTIGGLLEKRLLDDLRADGALIPLAELFAANAYDLLAADKARGHRFYAESWAVMRYLRSGVDVALTDAFRVWELGCRGGAAGAEIGKPDSRNETPACDLFRTQVLGERLPEIDKAFRAWLATL